jgi:hypothetical protein
VIAKGRGCSFQNSFVKQQLSIIYYPSFPELDPKVPRLAQEVSKKVHPSLAKPAQQSKSSGDYSKQQDCSKNS